MSADLVIPAATVVRYATARRPWLRGDHVHRLLGHAAGKRILEFDCGDGSNAVLLALRGAVVTGVTLDARGRGRAEQRADANGVGDCTRFETVSAADLDRSLPPGPFDVVLDSMGLRSLPAESRLAGARALLARLAPGGLLVVVEAVERPWLRWRTGGGGGLGHHEVDEITSLLQSPSRRYFGLLTIVLLRLNFAPIYEASAGWERVTYDAAGLIDRALLSLPFAKHLAQSVVIAGRPTVP